MRKILRSEDHANAAAIVNLPAPVNPNDAARLADITSHYDAFHFTQASAATTWVINHSLPFRPNVTVVDSLNREIIPDIQFTSGTQVTLTFSAAVAGEAYLS